MPNIRNVTFLIAAGYVLVLALIIGLGVETVRTVNKLQSISDDLYTHPFRVSNASLDAQSKIALLRNDMMRVALFDGGRKLDELSSETVSLDAAIRADFKVIRTAFLGDFGRLDEIDRQLDEWQQLRARIFGLVRQGKRNQARQLVATKGEGVFKRIKAGNDYVVDFARHEAQGYAENAARESARRIDAIWWLLGGLSILVSVLVFAIARRILLEFRHSEEFSRELVESEQKFHLLFEVANDCMLLLSADGRIVDINRIGYERLGYSKEEMLGRHVAEFDSPEYADQVPQRMALIRNEGCASFESAHVCKDGTLMPIEISARAVELHGQQMYFSVIRDITERKQFESELSQREARYRAVIETSADGFWIVDMEGRLVEVNDAYVRLSGYSREELLAMHIPDLEVRERPEETAAHIEKILREGHDRFETVHRRKDGSSWPVEIVSTYWPGVAGYLFVFATDITERKRQEEEQKLAVLVFQNISEAMSVTDAKNRIVAINPAFTELTGYTAEEVIGRNPNVLSSGRHDGEFYRQMWQALEDTGQWQGEIWDRRKNGELMAEWLTISTIYDDDGWVHRRVALFSDITKKKQSEETIWRQANFDPLTELPNRRLFRERLEQEIKKAHRTGTALALFFIDLDRFKEINDTLGHHVGDELLVEAANRIVSCVRESDTVARLGGDEFTVILSELPDDAHVERVAQDIIAKLVDPFPLGDEMVYISASVGITLYPADTTDADSLLKNADQAMYAAKDQGRNRFSYFTPGLEAEAQKRLRLIGDLRNALVEDQFLVYFQPIVDLSNGRIHKAEALLRWHHPQHGLVSPMDFIPLAEETGMINEIGDWVFMESARWTKRWVDMCGGDFQISVNKSPVQFMSEADIFEIVWFNYLRKLGLSGSNFVIEITEGLLLQGNDDVSNKLLSLRNAGVQVAIDDFGTGYSALSYLKKFHIDYLKIDKSFVSNIESDSNDMALCEAIIMMAHKLGLKVIAEGVETVGQLKLLSGFGCDYAQGYLFARPMPPEDFETLLGTELFT